MAVREQSLEILTQKLTQVHRGLYLQKSRGLTNSRFQEASQSEDETISFLRGDINYFPTLDQ